jgi:DNA/RNA-binding domain of Phe-tRNA-synthetase-like protein
MTELQRPPSNASYAQHRQYARALEAELQKEKAELAELRERVTTYEAKEHVEEVAEVFQQLGMSDGNARLYLRWLATDPDSESPSFQSILRFADEYGFQYTLPEPELLASEGNE